MGNGGNVSADLPVRCANSDLKQRSCPNNDSHRFPRRRKDDLNGRHGLRVAVLVNDFGAINIDAELVLGVKNDVISLANGCACCTIRDDLVATVLQTINRPEAPEYILLEASGVADPSGIAMAFVDLNCTSAFDWIAWPAWSTLIRHLPTPNTQR